MGRESRLVRGRRTSRGAALVEFALVLPLLVLFLFGIVQFGLAFDRKQSINSSAREGARIAALRTTTLAEIEGRATDAFANSLDGPLTIEVFRPATSVIAWSGAASQPCAAAVANDRVAVVISGPNDISIPLWGNETVTLRSRAEFRCESS